MKESRDINQILLQYSFIPKICALRFCTEETFEDFVQEGMLSICDKSFRMLNEEENTLSIIVRNCLRQQFAYYLRFYKDEYPLFNHPDIEHNNLRETLFGDSLKIDSIFENGDMDFQDTREIVRSFVDKCSYQLKTLLYRLYRL